MSLNENLRKAKRPLVGAGQVHKGWCRPGGQCCINPKPPATIAPCLFIDPGLRVCMLDEF